MNSNNHRPLWTACIMADADDPRRLYRRITDDVAALILNGTLRAGAALPSARDLAAIYCVSTMTGQRAINELQQCRYTYAIKGKGTFVHPRPAQSRYCSTRCAFPGSPSPSPESTTSCGLARALSWLPEPTISVLPGTKKAGSKFGLRARRASKYAHLMRTRWLTT
jgi:DNA-binding transcriptional regulator YhcF (GntR family)